MTRKPHIVYLKDFEFAFNERVPADAAAGANDMLASLKLNIRVGKGIDERAVMHRLAELELTVNSLF